VIDIRRRAGSTSTASSSSSVGGGASSLLTSSMRHLLSAIALVTLLCAIGLSPWRWLGEPGSSHEQQSQQCREQEVGLLLEWALDVGAFHHATSASSRRLASVLRALVEQEPVHDRASMVQRMREAVRPSCCGGARASTEPAPLGDDDLDRMALFVGAMHRLVRQHRERERKDNGTVAVVVGAGPVGLLHSIVSFSQGSERRPAVRVRASSCECLIGSAACLGRAHV